jgi:succinate dehydrogenase/fumarate reductase cytochrome b subunit
MKIALFTALTFVLTPLLVSAQAAPNTGYITAIVTSAQAILNLLIPLVVTIALILFFWGLALFIMNAGDEEARKRGRAIMIWGVVALFVIVAVWGLVALLANIFNVETGAVQAVPGVGGIGA